MLQTCLDGELDTTNTRTVTRHLAQCHRCDRRAAVFHAIKNTLARRKRPCSAPSAGDNLADDNLAGNNLAGNLPVPAVRRLRKFAETLRDESGQ